LFLKLFALAGVTWLIGVANSLSQLAWLGYVYIALNSLQGVFVFAAFAFSPQTRKHVRQSRLYAALSSATSFTSSRKENNRSFSDFNNSNTANRTVSIDIQI
jgi:hypothetical protein